MECSELIENNVLTIENSKKEKLITEKRKRGEITSVNDPTISIIDVRIYAMNKGGKCKDVEYTDPDAPMHWECAEGHSWTAPLRTIIKNHRDSSQRPWCPICTTTIKKINPPKHHKRTDPYNGKDMLAEMQKLAALHGGKCLSAEYINMKTKLLWVCKKGHKFWKRPRSVKYKDRWCNKCKGYFDRYPDNVPPKRRTKMKQSVKTHPENTTTSIRSKSPRANNVPHTDPSAPDISQIYDLYAYDLYAFDLNNCTVQYQHNFPQIKNGSPIHDLMRYIKTTSGKKYKAWWFTSENFKNTLGALKNRSNKINHLFIEHHLKNPRKRLYMDVDTAMCVKITDIMANEHKRISRFFLGTGDKDFYYLIQMAHKYQIPVTVIALSKDSLSEELKEYADHVYFLF
ncbi:MAG: NYN domain-containing protein [Candidatus Lokiarchaeota archaeon]|nr:NYN domain-containing protein [Candidatus Lokiarchaeota archaeon]